MPITIGAFYGLTENLHKVGGSSVSNKRSRSAKYQVCRVVVKQLNLKSVVTSSKWDATPTRELHYAVYKYMKNHSYPS